MKRRLLKFLLLALMTGALSACILPEIPKPDYGITVNRIWSDGNDSQFAYYRSTSIALVAPGMHAYVAERRKTRTYYRRLDLSKLKDGQNIALDGDTAAYGLLYLDRDFKVSGAPPGYMYDYTSVTFDTRGIKSTVECTPRTWPAPLRVEDSLIYCGFRVAAGGKATPVSAALRKYQRQPAIYQDGVIYFYTGSTRQDKPVSGPARLVRVDARSGKETGTVPLPMPLAGYTLRQERIAHSFLFQHIDKDILEIAVCTLRTCRHYRLKSASGWEPLTDLQPVVIGQSGDELVMLKYMMDFDSGKNNRVVRLKAGAPARDYSALQ